MTERKREIEREGTGLAHSAENDGLISQWWGVKRLRHFTTKLRVYLWWQGESPCFLFRPLFFLACNSNSATCCAVSTPGSLSGPLSSFLPPTSLPSLLWLCPGKRSSDDTEGAADGCVGEDAAQGSGCFLGRPGLLLFISPALCCVRALFCCPRLLQSPCKPAAIKKWGGGVGRLSERKWDRCGSVIKPAGGVRWDQSRLSHAGQIGWVTAFPLTRSLLGNPLRNDLCTHTCTAKSHKKWTKALCRINAFCFL